MIDSAVTNPTGVLILKEVVSRSTTVKDKKPLLEGNVIVVVGVEKAGETLVARNNLLPDGVGGDISHAMSSRLDFNMKWVQQGLANKGAPIKGKRKGKGKKRTLMSSEVRSDSGGKLKPKGRWARVSNKAHT